jgi:ankyrin repeat protein
MKYIKLFEEHSISVYELITMGANQVLNLLIEEIQKENPDLDLIRDILDYSLVDVNGKDSNGWTALMRSANWGKEKSLKLLLNQPGIDVNVQDGIGWTALMLAARWGKEKSVELLLKHPDIDVTLETEYGRTAWDMTSGYIRQKFPQLNPNFR